MSSILNICVTEFVAGGREYVNLHKANVTILYGNKVIGQIPRKIGKFNIKGFYKRDKNGKVVAVWRPY